MNIKINLPKPKAIIFDWDDTITHNWWRVVYSMNKTLEYMGYDTWSENEALRNLGASGRDVFPKIFGDDWQKASDIYYKFLNKTLKDAPEPIEGAVEAIKKLAALNDLYLAVLSNKRGNYLRKEIIKLGLDSCFSKVIGAGDYIVDKPDIAALKEVLKPSKLSLGTEIWFVGDSHTDMKCAHIGGCTAVMIKTKIPPEDMLNNIEPHISFNCCQTFTNFIFKQFYK